MAHTSERSAHQRAPARRGRPPDALAHRVSDRPTQAPGVPEQRARARVILVTAVVLSNDSRRWGNLVAGSVENGQYPCRRLAPGVRTFPLWSARSRCGRRDGVRLRLRLELGRTSSARSAIRLRWAALLVLLALAVGLGVERRRGAPAAARGRRSRPCALLCRGARLGALVGRPAPLRRAGDLARDPVRGRRSCWRRPAPGGRPRSSAWSLGVLGGAAAVAVAGLHRARRRPRIVDPARHDRDRRRAIRGSGENPEHGGAALRGHAADRRLVAPRGRRAPAPRVIARGDRPAPRTARSSPRVAGSALVAGGIGRSSSSSWSWGGRTRRTASRSRPSRS